MLGGGDQNTMLGMLSPVGLMLMLCSKHILLSAPQVRVVGNYTNWEVAKKYTHPQVILG